MGDNTNREILLAGAAAAFTVDLLVYPLDTIKTRLQSQDFVKTYASTGAKKVSPRFFKGLYQGVGSVIIATLPASGVFFTTYESAKQLYTSTLPSSLPQPFVHALASGTAELASCLILTPAEVIKQNAQMLSRTDRGGNARSTSLEAWRMLKRSEGGPARRLWSGYTALAARNLPFTAMQFPMFEYFRARLWDWRAERSGDPAVSRKRTRSRSRDGEELQEKIQAAGAAGERSTTSILWETGWVNGLSAGLSGSIAAVITTPSDVVKTRMMLVAGKDAEDRARAASGGLTESEKKRKPGGLQVARQVFQEHGIKGLFRGGALRAVWTFAGSGLYLGTYEMAKVWLKGGREVEDDTSF